MQYLTAVRSSREDSGGQRTPLTARDISDICDVRSICDIEEVYDNGDMCDISTISFVQVTSIVSRVLHP